MRIFVSFMAVVFTVVLVSGFTGVFEANGATRSVSLKRDCPRAEGTMKKSGGTVIFSLKHGQKGGCPSDKRARHGAPYWERSELKSSNFTKGKTYSFSVEVKFDPKFVSSSQTTFFQVHQYKKGSCPSCSPAVMIKANVNGAIKVAILRAGGGHNVHSLGITRRQIAGKWTKFTVKMGTGVGKKPISVLVNGRKKISGTVSIHPRGAIYLKTGLYRPGNRAGLPADRVHIRNVRYEVLK